VDRAVWAATGVAIHYDTEAIQDLGVHHDARGSFQQAVGLCGTLPLRLRQPGLGMVLVPCGMTII